MLCQVLGTTLPRLVQRYERLINEYQQQRKRPAKKGASRRSR
jgi:hypothetical protein